VLRKLTIFRRALFAFESASRLASRPDAGRRTEETPAGRVGVVEALKGGFWIAKLEGKWDLKCESKIEPKFEPCDFLFQHYCPGLFSKI
jgi:hypothetical protein